MPTAYSLTTGVPRSWRTSLSPIIPVILIRCLTLLVPIYEGNLCMAEQWLSIVDYARATGISDMTIRRRIRTGRIRAELRDGKYYIPVDLNSQETDRRAGNSNTHSHTQVVKNHPNPDRTVRHNFQDRSMPYVRRGEESHHAHNVNVASNHVGFSSANHSNRPAWNNVPDTMARPLVDAGLASVEARALIEFCDRALEQARSTVDAVEAKYAARIESMSAQLMNRDQDIKSLNQQIEDLQLLVQILERKKVG